MFAVIRSELARLRRPRMLAGWFGLTALFAIMTTQVMFSVVADGSAPKNGAGIAFPSLQTLTSSKGLLAGMAASSSIFGVITLSFWAIAVATDYSSGLIRLLVSAQPRRWMLLAGKAVSLALLTAIATTVATVATALGSIPAAKNSGVSTAAWSADFVSTALSGWLNCFLALLVWGVIGLTLAVVTRSSAIAISVGIGYVLVVESLIKQAMGDSSSWLPGSTLSALAAGGTATLRYLSAAGLGVGYIAIGITIAVVVFQMRDVTD